MSFDELIPAVDVPEGASGDWRVERFEISEERASIGNIGMMFKPGARRLRPGHYTRLMRGSTVVMSDTPDEKRDHYWFVRKASGNILINGLGLGMVLGAVLRKPDVETVTVVEASEDVIRLVARTYEGDPRVTIVQADALAFAPPKGVRYDAVWHDIWDDICADNLEQMKTLHRRYGRRAAWQGSWARELCERYPPMGNGDGASVVLKAVAGMVLIATPALADPCEAIPKKGPAPAEYVSPGAVFAGRIVYVGDGDGLCVAVGPRSGLDWVEVRLADFYAPELQEPGGAEAKAVLERVAKGKRATCVAEGKSWDRSVARCMINGRSIGDLMRQAGVPEGGRGR